MLYEFRVGNYLSYKDIQGIRMAPVLPREASEKGTKYGPVSNLMFLYGPNASGKSNIVKAIEFARQIVYEGFCDKVDQFYERNQIETCPSYFEFVFDMPEFGDGNIYSYGFEINASGGYFESEWLCNLSAKEDKFLYQISNEDADPKGEMLGLPIVFSRIDPNFPEFNMSWNDQLIEDLEYNNNMFWPIQINQIDYPELKELKNLWKKVRKYISESILVKIGNALEDDVLLIDYGVSVGEFNDFLNAMNTNTILPAEMCIDYWEDETKDKFMLFYESHPEFLEYILYKLSFKNDDGRHDIEVNAPQNKVYFLRKPNFANPKTHLYAQSSGTYRMLYLVTLLFLASKREKKNLSTTFVIDEIECNLNSNNLLGFLKEYCKSNFNHTQLIVTTHESRILEEEYADRDTVSFVQRKFGSLGESEIYALRCFGNTPIYSTVDYLDNRFGSMPTFKQPVFERPHNAN